MMDISATPLSNMNAYANNVANAVQTMTRPAHAVAPSEAPSAQNAEQSNINSRNPRQEAERLLDEARRRDTNQAQKPQAAATFKVDYIENQRVVKVNNRKGELIYQMPSKGKLQLIQAEERQAKAVDVTA